MKFSLALLFLAGLVVFAVAAPLEEADDENELGTRDGQLDDASDYEEDDIVEPQTELQDKGSLTKCQQLQVASKPGVIGAFVPQCKANGEFEEKQCWASTGYCWCVDGDGQEILGTKTRGRLDCSSAEEDDIVEPQTELQDKGNLTKCQQLQVTSKPGLIGAFVPQCKANGEFEEKQCWASIGYCWCVDRDGQEILGTKTRGRLDCSSAEVTTEPPSCSMRCEWEWVWKYGRCCYGFWRTRRCYRCPKRDRKLKCRCKQA